MCDVQGLWVMVTMWGVCELMGEFQD